MRVAGLDGDGARGECEFFGPRAGGFAAVPVAGCFAGAGGLGGGGEDQWEEG